MERELVTPRADWVAQCEAVGFAFHSIDGTYWDESRCYRFTADEIDRLEAAAVEVHARCLDAAEHIVSRGRMGELAIPTEWRDRVARSWRAKEPSLFGRFDFAFAGRGEPKLLEYNADTPTALLEASVVQWHWLQQAVLPREPDADQFNSLHEKLIASFRALAITWSANTVVHFTCAADSDEDAGNLDLRDVATQAGLSTRSVGIDDIGWDRNHGVFVDAGDDEIAVLVKLYPWEWLAGEAFGPNLLASGLRVIEPCVEDAAVEQGAAADPVELFPGHRCCGLLQAGQDRGRLRREAAAFARGRQRRPPPRRQHRRGAG